MPIQKKKLILNFGTELRMSVDISTGLRMPVYKENGF